jgi:hypothetical protein
MSAEQDGIKNMLPKWATTPSTHVVKPWMKLGAAALVVFTIVMFAMYYRTMGDIDAGLYGFWEVDGDFAEKAHLDAMYLYIGAPKNDAKRCIGILGCEVPIYVFLKADCAVRFNKVAKSFVSRRSARTDSLQKYSIDFGAPVSIIPQEVSAEYDHVTQMLVLRDSKRIYARMFKKPEVSFYCTSSSIVEQDDGEDTDDDQPQPSSDNSRDDDANTDDDE